MFRVADEAAEGSSVAAAELEDAGALGRCGCGGCGRRGRVNCEVKRVSRRILSVDAKVWVRIGEYELRRLRGIVAHLLCDRRRA